MNELLRLFRGYVFIRLSGDCPERFINLCGNKGIFLWNIRREQDCCLMYMRLVDFWRIRPMARKTGTRAVVLKRYGLPFFLPKMWKRMFFLSGFVLAVTFWIVTSYFVWDIDIRGNYRITDQMITGFLSEREVRPGMRKQTLDINLLEKEIRQYFGQITWVCVQLEGTTLLVTVKEYDAPAEIDEKIPTPSSLIAESETEIVSIIVRSGIPKVKIGDLVQSGTVLVDGKVPVLNDDGSVREYFYVEADADVVGQHRISFTESCAGTYIKKQYTGRIVKRNYLIIGGHRMDVSPACDFLLSDVIQQTQRPPWFEKLSIPIFTGVETCREYYPLEAEYSVTQAEEILYQKLARFLQTLEEKGVQIIEKNVKIDTDDVSWFLYGDFLVREAVGKKEPISSQDTVEE